MMRRKLVVIVLIGSFYLQCSKLGLNNDSGKNYGKSITSGDVERQIWVHIPDKIEGMENPPLVIALHGSGDTGKDFQINTGLDKEADKFGFIMVYPEGIGKQWAAGVGNEIDKMGVNDVGFITDIIEYFHQDLQIDLNRVYITGFSLGGILAHRLAVDITEKIAAFAPVGASMSNNLKERNYIPTGIPVLIINGTHDESFPLEGTDSYIFGYLSQLDLLKQMLFNNGCDSEPDTLEYLPDRKNDGKRIRRAAYMNSDNVTVVEYYMVEYGGHDWHIGDINTPEVILEFFTRFRKN